MEEKSIDGPNVRYAQGRSWEILKSVSDITKAINNWGFSIDYKLENGLKDTIN